MHASPHSSKLVSFHKDLDSKAGMTSKSSIKRAVRAQSLQLERELTTAYLNDKIDIAFLHSDFLVYQTAAGQKQALPESKTLQPEQMFSIIQKNVARTMRQLLVKRQSLNVNSLKEVIDQAPRVLFINCHAERVKQETFSKSETTVTTYFCFEDPQVPTLQDKFDEQRLIEYVKRGRHEIQVVVISACHSSRLAEIMHKFGFPVVVGITQSQEILETAAYVFNDEFLKQILAGQSPKQAFDEGITKLRASKNCVNCCCDHEHDVNYCLWYRYAQKHGIEAAHALHDTSVHPCSCDLGAS